MFKSIKYLKEMGIESSIMKYIQLIKLRQITRMKVLRWILPLYTTLVEPSRLVMIK